MKIFAAAYCLIFYLLSPNIEPRSGSMFLAVGETHGTKNTQKRISSNNLFLLSSCKEGGRKRNCDDYKRFAACITKRRSRKPSPDGLRPRSPTWRLRRQGNNGSLQKPLNAENPSDLLDRGCVSRQRILITKNTKNTKKQSGLIRFYRALLPPF